MKVNPQLAGMETSESTPKSLSRGSPSPLTPLETTAPAVVTRGQLGPAVVRKGEGDGGGATAAEIDTASLKNFIGQKFPGAVLMEEHQVLYIMCSIIHCQHT